jgi:hypothetical protein
MKAQEKQAEKEFKRFAKRHLMHPKRVRRIEQTQHFIYELHKLINDYRLRFNYVPDEAHLMFSEYQNIQDRMVYENFRQTYHQVSC